MTSLSPPPRPVPNKLAEVPLVIDTPRLRLRPVVDGDAEALFAYASDPEVAKTMSWDPHADVAETRAFIARQVSGLANGTDLALAIEHEGRAVGCIGLHGIGWQFKAWRIDRAELGYWLGRPFWGQGLVTEAAMAVTRWGFETLGLHKITIGCIVGNAASKKIIEKIGFRFLCVQEEDFWRDGRWQGHYRFELTAGEWADSTRTLRFRRPM